MAAGSGVGLPFTSRAGEDSGAAGAGASTDSEDKASIAQVFEFLLTEWHITQDYIILHWTDEEFALMLDKLVERKQREKALIKGEEPTRRVSEEQFFKEAGIKVKRNVN